MKKRYLITGASGHVGTMLVEQLKEQNAPMRLLVHSSAVDRAAPNIELCRGDISHAPSLDGFFRRSEGEELVLLHCAARITIASRPDAELWRSNVLGTRNVLEQALRAGVERVVYVSSVHAIAEKPKPEVITEAEHFSPELVYGQYAKSKAAAAQLALDYAKRGLPVSIVHPSGIIGPGDLFARNHMIRTLRAMAAGRIPVGIEGGYDFVDSRDVAGGILACAQQGVPGECYILSGRYITIAQLLNKVRRLRGRRPSRIVIPYALVRPVAPVAEKLALLGRDMPILTPYSLYALHANGFFSHEKASRAFGYAPRSIDESIRDSL